MSDKPKTLKEYLDTKEWKRLSHYATEWGKLTSIWNAATEASRAEYDEKIKAMQAKIDALLSDVKYLLRGEDE